MASDAAVGVLNLHVIGAYVDIRAFVRGCIDKYSGNYANGLRSEQFNK